MKKEAKKKLKKIVVNDLMQKNYVYYLSEPKGKNFDAEFKPELTPEQMLKLGVFGGKYMTDCKKEFPKSWYKGVKLSPEFHNPELNFFKVNASQPLSVWVKNGWIYHEDPRGWFQWYCRYFMGRRELQKTVNGYLNGINKIDDESFVATIYLPFEQKTYELGFKIDAKDFEDETITLMKTDGSISTKRLHFDENGMDWIMFLANPIIRYMKKRGFFKSSPQLPMNIQGKVDIIVKDLDETDYLNSSSKNKQYLEEAIQEVIATKLIKKTPEELNL